MSPTSKAGQASKDAKEAALSDSMSANLAENWWVLALRGVLAVIFGLIVFFMPVETMLSLLLIFAAYMLVDGIFAIISAVRAARQGERWGLAHGRFWEMHDGLYENQNALGLPLYLALAEALGLSKNALKEALENGTFRPKVRTDFMGGLRGGVNGTPTFIINGRRHDAPYDFDHLVAAIDADLAQVTRPAVDGRIRRPLGERPTYPRSAFCFLQNRLYATAFFVR